MTTTEESRRARTTTTGHRREDPEDTARLDGAVTRDDWVRYRAAGIAVIDLATGSPIE